MATSYTIQYGAHVFKNPRLEVTEGIRYDEVGTRTGVGLVFVVSGWLTGTTLADFQAQVNEMECELRVPRKAFEVKWEDKLLWSFDDKGSDVDFGPKPIELQIERFAGGLAARYRWQLQVEAFNCYNSQCSIVARQSEVLSIVWRWSHDVDPSGFTTRTVSGKLLVTGTAVLSDSAADHYRYVITNAIPQPQWFKRERQSFRQSANGRELEFEIVDVEKQWTLPNPITAGRASWSVRLGFPELMVEYELSGHFETSAAHTKKDLLNAVFNLAISKFPTTGAIVSMQRDITESVYENAIDFRISATGPAGADSAGQTNYTVGLATFLTPPPGSDGQAILINPYGQTDGKSSGVIAGSPKLYDACNPAEPNFKQALPTGELTYTNGGSTPGSDTNYPDQLKGISGLHLENPIVAIHEEVSYEIDNHLVCFEPKLANATPFIQQTAPASLVVIQSGYQQQYATDISKVRPPTPPILAPGATARVLHSSISGATPEPNSDGTWNKYTSRWTYVIRYAGVVQGNLSGDSAPRFPVDPRRPGTGPSAGDIPTKGLDLVEIADA